jgi:hypothetical protein
MADEQEPFEPDDEDGPFNPFINERDMFKVLLYVAAFCAIVALLALLIRTVG